jgi:hypothetical protein
VVLIRASHHDSASLRSASGAGSSLSLSLSLSLWLSPTTPAHTDARRGVGFGKLPIAGMRQGFATEHAGYQIGDMGDSCSRKGYRPSAFLTALMMRSLFRSDNAICSIGAPLGGATTVATSASHSSLKAMESARPATVPRENTV